jgi:hypothetical protein
MELAYVKAAVRIGAFQSVLVYDGRARLLPSQFTGVPRGTILAHALEEIAEGAIGLVMLLKR